jgi:hypothetical protein
MAYERERERERERELSKVSSFFKQPTTTNNMHLLRDSSSSFHEHPGACLLNCLLELAAREFSKT